MFVFLKLMLLRAIYCTLSGVFFGVFFEAHVTACFILYVVCFIESLRYCMHYTEHFMFLLEAHVTACCILYIVLLEVHVTALLSFVK